MKRNYTFTLLIALLFSFLPGCQENDEEVSKSSSPLVHSMKGYELYSWKTDDHWNYTLITGTNRNKWYDEIVATDNIEDNEWIKISVNDLDELKKLLSRVPENESIFWINSDNRVAGFSLPDALT